MRRADALPTRRVHAILGLLSALIVVTAWSPAVVSAHHPVESGTHSPAPERPLPPGSVEAPELRTEMSRTWVRPDGTHLMRVSRHPINYKAAGGSWKPIDNELVSDGPDEWRNRADRHTVTVPKRLDDGPIRVAVGEQWLTFRMLGADAVGEVDGAEARFDEAAPGVSARWTSENAALKEELVLENASAEHEFEFAVDASAGLTVRGTPDGGGEVVDADHRTVFALAAPFAVDAAGVRAPDAAVTMTLTPTGGNWKLALSVDPEWLQDSSRAFPVVLDPTVNMNPTRDCTIDPSAHPGDQYCSSENLFVGWSDIGAPLHDHRALLQFDPIITLPLNVQIQSAQLSMWLQDQSHPGAAKNLAVHRLTAGWDDNARWVQRLSGASWALAGGDYASTAEDTQAIPGPLNFMHWNVTNAVTSWVDGTQPNYGLILVDKSAQVNNLVTFDALEWGDPGAWADLDIQYTVNRSPIDRAKLGLENYFSYESTPTGAGTAAHVNVANGNVVWHSTPMVNPGRGLSTVVNLTYNSQDKGGYFGQLLTSGNTADYSGDVNALPGVAYGEAGVGFSLGISGITRLNEPLTGVKASTDPSGTASQIKLTDVDGTRHVFTKIAGTQPYAGTWYTPPAGVELALRYQPSSETDPLRRWAATRPDGVTYYFDADGYQTLIVDRNTNKIRFEYERYSKKTGLVSTCNGTPAASQLCTKRVVRVVDPKGVELSPTGPVVAGTPAGDRALHISYETDPVMPNGAGSWPTAAVTGPVGGDASRIKQILDHKGRILDFTYSSNGYLTDLKIKGGTQHPTDERHFSFEYEGAAAARQLHRVLDPRRESSTYIHNEADAPGVFSDGILGRRAAGISNRRDFGTEYRYDTDGPGTFRARAPENATTLYTLLGDGTGRVDRITNPVGSVTKLAWSTDNYLTSHTRAFGTAQAATTSTVYDRHGNPTTVTDPLGRVTTVKYQFSSHLGLPPGGDDDGKAYVSSFIWLKRPKDATSTEPTVWVDMDSRGNVIGRTYRGKATAQTAYDSWGQVTWQEDERDNRTSFFDYDANGLPTRIVDPRETAVETIDNGSGTQVPYKGTWRYRYDEVGNLLAQTDPRGTATTVGSPYTTSFVYDAFDQVQSSQAPKCTNPDTGYCPTALWINRSMTYDKNGNQLSTTDGTSKTTDYSFTPMDQIEAVLAPQEAHYGNSTPVREATRFEYDGRENQTKVVSPNGNETTTVHDYTTLFTYDGADRRTAEIRRSRGSAGACTVAGPAVDCDLDLVTSYAHDLRDNVIGVADARTNPTTPAAPAVHVANASAPATQRWQYAYDLADQQTDATEAPGAGADENLITHTDYDANGNVWQVISPRGMKETVAAERAKFTTTYAYDIRDQVIEAREGGTAAFLDPDNARVSTYSWFDNGQLESVRSPRGYGSASAFNYFTRYIYNRNSEVERIVFPPRDVSDQSTGAEIRYKRNALGDPDVITDARGVEFPNEFYDTGDLKKTDRPAWWAVAGSASGLVERSPEELRTFTGSEIPKTSGSGDFGSVNGVGRPDLLPNKGRPRFTYDAEMRLTKIDVEGIDAGENLPHQITDIARDAMGRVTQITRPFMLATGDNPRTPWDDTVASKTDIVEKVGYDYSGNAVQHIDGKTFESITQFDQFDRVVAQTAPGARSVAPEPESTASLDAGDARETTHVRWDGNDNRVKVTDPRGNATELAYDRVDRLTESKDPLNARTDYRYDANGNQTCERTPRGWSSGSPACAAGAYTVQSDYNRFDELRVQHRFAGEPGDWTASLCSGGAQPNECLQTEYAYDKNGNQTSVDTRGAGREPSGSVLTQTVARTFNGRDELLSETQGATTADRTRTGYTYDDAGNLRRAVTQRGWDATNNAPMWADSPTWDLKQDNRRNAHRDATTYVTDDNGLLIDRWLPWDELDTDDPAGAGHKPDSGRDPRRYYQHFERDGFGRVKRIEAPHAENTPDTYTTRAEYTYYENGWIKRSEDLAYIRADGSDPAKWRRRNTSHYTYDAQGNQRTWRITAPATLDEDEKTNPGVDDWVRQHTRDYYPGGQLARRHARKGPNDSSTRHYAYAYAPGSLQTIAIDNRSEDLCSGCDNDNTDDRQTNFEYDANARLLLSDETWPNGKDSRFAYDLDGNVSKRETDGALSNSFANAKVTLFDYDTGGRETRMRVWKGQPPSGQTGALRTVNRTYWPSSHARTITRLNAAVERRYYDTQGRIVERRRDPTAGGIRWDKYRYDDLGNRDEDNHGVVASGADSRQSFEAFKFNARSQMIDSRSNTANSRVTYKYNGSSSLQERWSYTAGANPDIDSDDVAIGRIAHVIEGDRTLETAASDASGTPVGSPRYHDYDRRTGDMLCSSSTVKSANSTGAQNDRTCTNGVNYTYDEFGRVTRSTDREASEPSTYFTYDAIDRRDRDCKGSQSVDACDGSGQGGHDFGYIGSSEAMSSSKGTGNKSARTQTFDYSSQGSRVGQVSETTSGSTTATEVRSYITDPTGTVLGLEKSDGDVSSNEQYGYDSFGKAQQQTTPSTEAAENPFRFQGFAYDTDSRTYDMQARAYQPDVQRFTTPDRFEDATGDFALQADPLTQDRYAFGGGNPVNNIEFDGHEPITTFNPNGQQRANDKSGKCHGDCEDSKFDVSPPKMRGTQTYDSFSKRRAVPKPVPGSNMGDSASGQGHQNKKSNFKPTPGEDCIPNPGGGCAGTYHPSSEAGEGIHLLLDYAGMAPGLGAIPDLANAAIYGLEGDFKNVAASSGKAIPIGGDIASAGSKINKARRAVGGGAGDGIRAKKSWEYGDIKPQGSTDWEGNITIRTGLKGKELRETVRHETVHSVLTPKRGPFVAQRRALRQKLYRDSDLARYAEEALAEGYATRDLRHALRYPLRGGYDITKRQLKTEAARVAGVGAGAAAAGAGAYWLLDE